MDQVQRLSELLGSPFASPWYAALWTRFTTTRPVPGETDDRDPILDPKERLPFERYFWLAWWQLLEGTAGMPLKTGLTAMKELRTSLMQQLVLADMATWDERHVFGNTSRETFGDDVTVPFMALDEVYVEPKCRPAGETSSREPKPITAAVREALDGGARVVVVTADFGNGKSLSARRLARDWAVEWIQATVPSTQGWRPTFVRCASCLDMNADPSRAISRSRKAAAAAIDPALDFAVEDSAYDAPSAGQRVIEIFDGLDEVVLGSENLRQFFRALADASTDTRRFIVFTRPGALPLDKAHLAGAKVLELTPLDDMQIDDWIERWNKIEPRWFDARRKRDPGVAQSEPLRPDDLESQELLELAKTPILLFMIAHGHATSGSVGASRAELYESFFRHIARGKYEHDKESDGEHRAIAEASNRLLAELQRKDLLKRDATQPDAMLWFMSRVAWEAACLDWREHVRAIRDGEGADHSASSSLTHHDVRNLVTDVLGSRDEGLIHAIKVGALLALQADPRDDNHEIVFGHRSFREFLIARYWVDRLRAALNRRDDARNSIMRGLAQGRFLGDEGKSFDFIKQSLNSARSAESGSPFGWTKDERDALHVMCWEEFLRETPIPGDPSASFEHVDDRRPILREAMLSIAALTGTISFPKPRGALPLLSLWSFFWGYGGRLKLRLANANLSGAILSRAILSGAILSNANLSNANLSGAVLQVAMVSRANLSGANLSGARLQLAILKSANLSGAILSGAALRRTLLSNANLSGADLSGADLSGADLSGADLSGADLSGADLSNAILHNIRYDSATTWPEGFDPPQSVPDQADIEG